MQEKGKDNNINIKYAKYMDFPHFIKVTIWAYCYISKVKWQQKIILN